MKKRLLRIITIVLAIGSLAILANIRVPTRQGMNYQVQVKKIPLYLKILDFYDRNFNYVELARRINQGAKSEEDKALRIFNWVKANIHKAPQGLPVIDDHVWHTIVRGYGKDDQFQDVFTTLCNYSGLEAFFDYFKDRSGGKKPLSMVKIGNKWRIFDAYNGVYFRDRIGQIASAEDLLKGDYSPVGLDVQLNFIDYKEYFHNLAAFKYDDWQYSRSAIQSPLRRFIFWGKKKK